MKNNIDFIRDARRRHGDLFDYSKVNYTGSTNKVIVICRKHGEFSQEANAHLRGQKCPKCKGELNSKRCLSSIKDFITKSRAVHGDLFDYSKVNYTGSTNKVIVICRKHGKFKQKPNAHLNGQGCMFCYREKLQKKLSKGLLDFINDAKIIHGDLFDYSKVVYVNSFSKVIIICRKHGEFKQEPHNHLKGSRCPKCNKVILDNGASCDSYIDAYYYLIFIENGEIFEYNKEYGSGLGGKRFDFYFPIENKYLEVTNFSPQYKYWNKYFANICCKKKYVEEVLGGKFEFISRRLLKRELDFVMKHIKG